MQLVGLCLSLISSAVFLLTGTFAAAQTRKLGFSGPLSGSAAAWGTDIKNSLIFANEKLAGGRYSFIFEDDRCDPKSAVTAAEKLSKIDRIEEVFVVCGQAVLNTAPIYNRAGITVLAPLATPSRISELGIFRTSMSDALAAEKLAGYVAARHNEVFVLSEENDYPLEFLKDFNSHAAKFGLSVEDESFGPDQREFRPQLLKLKSKKAGALFLNTQTEATLAALVRQLAELKMTPKLYGAYLPGSSHFLEIAGWLADGLIFVDFPGAEEMLNDEGKKLFSEYTARFGKVSGWSFALPATYEAFRAVHSGLESGQDLKSYLANTTFNGIFGRYSFDKHGDIVGPKHVLRIIRGGKPELLTEGSDVGTSIGK